MSFVFIEARRVPEFHASVIFPIYQLFQSVIFSRLSGCHVGGVVFFSKMHKNVNEKRLFLHIL